CYRGLGDQLGCFESRVFGVGPQATYVIPLGDLQGALNLKWSKDFDWAHRAHGGTGCLTFELSNNPTDTQATATHRYRACSVTSHARSDAPRCRAGSSAERRQGAACRRSNRRVALRESRSSPETTTTCSDIGSASWRSAAESTQTAAALPC